MLMDKDSLLEAIISNVPKPFLNGLNKRIQAAYLSEYHRIKDDPSTLDDQKGARLLDDRYYRIETELHDAAQEAGLPVTARPVAQNSWTFVYVKSNGVGFTQSYVPRQGDFPPNKAKFRQQLAAESALPRFDLGDDDIRVFQPCDFYALIAHNPLGKDFSEDKQHLGGLQLCVPDSAMESWLLQMSIVEIISMYPADSKETLAKPEPIMKSVPKKKRGEG